VKHCEHIRKIFGMCVDSSAVTETDVVKAAHATGMTNTQFLRARLCAKAAGGDAVAREILLQRLEEEACSLEGE